MVVSNLVAKSTRPLHLTLAVVFQVRDASLQVLMWQRARDPFNSRWALPGGYLDPDETLERSIRRHLAAKVDVRELAHLEQLETRSDPRRNKAPEAIGSFSTRTTFHSATRHFQDISGRRRGGLFD